MEGTRGGSAMIEFMSELVMPLCVIAAGGVCLYMARPGSRWLEGQSRPRTQTGGTPTRPKHVFARIALIAGGLVWVVLGLTFLIKAIFG